MSTNGSGWSFGAGSISTDPIPLNTWTHVALVRSGGTIRSFINGVPFTHTTGFGTGSLMTTYTANWIGMYPTNVNPNAQFGGYRDDVRITIGVARYTTTFQAPAAAYPNY